ncbi:hypothetical protein CYMTET_15869 [Cymbomonas tetramitiformis]|uniref:ELMO domain-containing protein n=1 Tax=Cymbomonas tetramitiformis TaxID=36881 RepID=A0AAE0GD50_9CHLO|nr:hypothetical protein CYMTET_15869 [Cymbomonas tetramitiformis]
MALRQRSSKRGLDEPLLDADDDEASPSRTESRETEQNVEWDGLRPCLVEGFYTCAKLLVGLARRLGLMSTPPITLTPTQERTLKHLWDRIRVPFDGSLEEHQMELRRLWRAAYGDRELPALKTPLWKEMGWQGEDPGTDFRAAGFISLENLIFLGEQQPDVFQRLLTKSDGERSDWEYPFCVAGVNITFMLVDVLQLRKEPAIPDNAPSRGFFALVEMDEHAFENLYCATFELLDRQWLLQKATYMEFSGVMAATRKVVEEALTDFNCKSAEELYDHLRTAC